MNIRFKHALSGIAIFVITLAFLFLAAEGIFRVYYHVTGEIIASDEEEKCLKSSYKKASNVSDPYRFEPYYPPHGEGELEYSNITGLTITNNIEKNTDLHPSDLGKGYFAKMFQYDIITNSQHMRAMKDFKYDKNSDILRIVLLGDSYTWGDDVLQNYSYASFLENTIPTSEVLNFGIKGIGIDLMYLRWKYEALEFKPDVVVMTIYTDDIRRAQPCVHKPIFNTENDKLVVANIPPPSYEEIFENYEEPGFESYFLKHISYNLKYLHGVIKTQYDYGFTILPFILDEMKLRSEKDGTFFMVAIINAESTGYQTYEEKAVGRLKQLLEAKNIPYVESFEIFESEGFEPLDQKLYLGHFSVLGNALFAQGIKNKLEEYKITQDLPDYYFDYDMTKDLGFVLTNKNNPSNVMRITSWNLTFYNESGKIERLPDGIPYIWDYTLFYSSYV